MFQSYNFTVAEKFMNYVQIDTQSDPHSNSFPSTEKQKDLEGNYWRRNFYKWELQTPILMITVMCMRRSLQKQIKMFR